MQLLGHVERFNVVDLAGERVPTMKRATHRDWISTS